MSINKFNELHNKDNPIILYNIWDAGSAKVVESAGAAAVATGSAPVALAQGFEDGEKIPFSMALENIKRIIAAVSVPVSMDLEGGYNADASQVANCISEAVDAGIAGFNFEDQIIGGQGLYELEDQIKRVAAARAGADSIGEGVFLNARTDIFLKAKAESHDETMLDAAIERAKAFEQAGADGFFAPGLVDPDFIRRLCDLCPLPVNIIALPHAPDLKSLKGLGVSRISFGPLPYRGMLNWLSDQARRALNSV